MEIISKRTRDKKRKEMLESVGKGEVWRHPSIKGNTSKDFEISSMGRVRKVTNGEIKKQFLSNAGYWQTWMGNIGSRNVHRVLLSTFLPLNKEEYTNCQVNHIDGDKGNNSLSNLEWVTREENMAHAFDNNLVGGVVPVRAYHTDGTFIGEYTSATDAGEAMGVHERTLASVLQGKDTDETVLYGGYLWRRSNESSCGKAEDIESISSKDIKVGHSNGGVHQISMTEDTLLAHYSTITKVYAAFGKEDNGHISHACKGEIESAWGYRWKYSIDIEEGTYRKSADFGSVKYTKIKNPHAVRFLEKYGGIYKMNEKREVLDFYEHPAPIYKERGTSDTGYVARKCREANFRNSRAWGFYWRYGKDVDEDNLVWLENKD